MTDKYFYAVGNNMGIYEDDFDNCSDWSGYKSGRENDCYRDSIEWDNYVDIYDDYEISDYKMTLDYFDSLCA